MKFSVRPLIFFVHFNCRIPIIGGKELDLHRLFVEVTSRGGIEKVIWKSWRLSSWVSFVISLIWTIPQVNQLSKSSMSSCIIFWIHACIVWNFSSAIKMSKDAMSEHIHSQVINKFWWFFGLYIFIELDEWWNSICVCSVFKRACCLNLLFDVFTRC